MIGKSAGRGLETEMYVWYGTNEDNFVKLENPPKYKPTERARCKRVINLGEDGYSMKGGKYYYYYCDRCPGFDLSRLSSARSQRYPGRGRLRCAGAT